MKKLISLILSVAMIFSSVASYAQGVEAMGLPMPGMMIAPSAAFQPAAIRGLTVDTKNPFKFNFIVDLGDSQLAGPALSAEGQKLIKYFLATLALPEKDIWVNLSPVEKDRVITDALSKTEMGQEMLAQDYILKQLTSSLMYPEKELGKAFWGRVYAKAQEQFGTTDIPVDTFNKVWIVA
ncbi:MAG: hypothetical protein HQL19_06860, partial [Candidatus Omnitrophica bacterium]|nr:hypothetical protein [Candidatus Omnitrophota bacterium]